MKKLIILTMLSIICLTGCGSNKDLEELEDIIQTISIEQEPEIVSGLPETKEELLTMSLDDFKVMIEQTIPNYREHFKVPNDYVLTDEDWESFRTILSLELFKSAQLDNIEPKESEEVDFVVQETEENDPNEIYYNPSVEYINGLTDEEFVEYLTNAHAYNYPDVEMVDYSQLTSEDIKKVRDSLIEGLK